MTSSRSKKLRIVRIETSNPSLKMSQADVLSEVVKHQKLSSRFDVLRGKFFGDHGIQTRHFAFDDVGRVFKESYDQAVERFTAASTEHGARAAQRACSLAEVPLEDISALIVTTCTGYVCPGLSTYIAQRLNLKSDIFLLDLVGQGCGAAGPALKAAEHFLKARPDSYALVVCVEICSAAFSDGEDIELLISNAIFGDGAAAALVTDQQAAAGLEISAFESVLKPEYRDDLRFKTKNSRLCNVLGKNVPVLAGQTVKDLQARFQKESSPKFFAFHTGGRLVLDEIQKALALGDEHMTFSRDILRRYGNMSSPSILYVLKEMMDSGSLIFHDDVLAFTFGAGFTAHSFWATYKPGEKNGGVRTYQRRFFKKTADSRRRV